MHKKRNKVNDESRDKARYNGDLKPVLRREIEVCAIGGTELCAEGFSCAGRP